MTTWWREQKERESLVERAEVAEADAGMLRAALQETRAGHRPLGARGCRCGRSWPCSEYVRLSTALGLDVGVGKPGNTG